ncbi:MAG: cysteine desulfurase [Lachnospiraceae bacterium]|nr:cysteine desulfurase [Lachnospiraceae bacterium]
MNKTIYLDNAATTRICDEALEEMRIFLGDEFASPLGQYDPGFRANHALETARKRVAQLIGADPMEITFTSSGTESDNLFIRGSVYSRLREMKNHEAKDEEIVIVTSATEHAAVLKTCEDLADFFDKIRLIKVPVLSDGFLDEKAYAAALHEHPFLVSIMHVNNETGIVNDIKKYCEEAHRAGALFHTDAVQSVPHMRLNVKDIGADGLSASGHKLHGPKGSGFLYIKRGTPVCPIITGGGQEREMRSGTPGVGAAAGLGRACEVLAERGYEDDTAAEAAKLFESKIRELMPFARINRPGGAAAKEVSGKIKYIREIVSVSIPGGESLSLLPDLDMAGVCCSAGAACSAGKEGVSHVLKAMGMDDEISKGTLRFSFSRYNTCEEAAEAADLVSGVIIKNLRNHGKNI